MFITLQLPYIDLRPFLLNPPPYVPPQMSCLHNSTGDFEEKAENNFVRHFGKYMLRGYIPEFHKKKRGILPNWLKKEENLWDNLSFLWKDEYLFASARRGLRFKTKDNNKHVLEKGLLNNGLLNDKLVIPRVKIRALRFSPYKTNNSLWSPSMRIEVGILYTVKGSPLDGDQLIKALLEFLKIKVVVPSYKVNGSGSNAVVQLNRRITSTLIDQKTTLGNLIVYGTTSQKTAQRHPQMVIGGEPLLTVHYSPHELSSLPNDSISIPSSLNEEIKTNFCQIRNKRIGVWLFEMPPNNTKHSKNQKRRIVIRNNTIAIMRYWSELQSMLSLRREILKDPTLFNKHIIEDYINRETNFLMSDNAYGTQLRTIKNTMNSYSYATNAIITESKNDLTFFKRQIREKLINFSNDNSNVFVSYSHKDVEYLPIIQNALSPLLDTIKIGYFDDTHIKPGNEFEPQILNQLDSASCIILLVSNNFQKSNYINHVEFPRIINNYQIGKVVIIPILIRGRIPNNGILQCIQYINPNKPLSIIKKNTCEINSFINNLNQRVKNLYQKSTP